MTVAKDSPETAFLKDIIARQGGMLDTQRQIIETLTAALGRAFGVSPQAQSEAHPAPAINPLEKQQVRYRSPLPDLHRFDPPAEPAKLPPGAVAAPVGQPTGVTVD